MARRLRSAVIAVALEPIPYAAEIYVMNRDGQTRIGFEFKAGASTTPRDWAHLQAGITDKVIDRGVLVYNGIRAFPASDKIRVVPAAEILTTAAKW